MDLAFIDYVIIIAFLLLSLIIGIALKNKAEGSLVNFFLGGRNLPWYVAGISMVATTFAADTPLAVTELVKQNGISGNWLWWSFLIGGMLTTFFFANLWRRAEILTELEFINLRYSGKEAVFLRGFKSVYLGLFMNVMVIAWVNLAFKSILMEFFNISPTTIDWFLFASMAIAVIYTSVSGLLGVAITDMLQFVIAMTGTIILAVIVVNSNEVGGIDGIKNALPDDYLSFFPSVSAQSTGITLSLSIGAFLTFIGIQWWASWYPGAEPGGGGYIAQRMMSTKNEKHSVLATLFFQIAHYCIRPWPWILVGLSAIVIFGNTYKQLPDEVQKNIAHYKTQSLSQEEIIANLPNFKNYSLAEQQAVLFEISPKLGYVFCMKNYLPKGLKGLLLVAFIAAYLSTISTQLNWGASLLVNDLYLLIKPSQKENIITVSRIMTILIMTAGIFATKLFTSISGVWEFILECGAGLGLVLILRWYWWRINAWSEITATTAPFVWFTIGKFILAPLLGAAFTENKGTYLFTIIMTTLSWIVITYTTKPVNEDKLLHFYKKVKPSGVWKNFAQKHQLNYYKFNYPLLITWISSVIFGYSILFLTGALFFKSLLDIIIYLTVAAISLIIAILSFKKANFKF